MSIATFVCTLLAFNGVGLDLHVEGSGLLRFARAGRVVYAKKASLKVTAGHLTADGCDLLPQISVPEGTKSLDVDLEGTVYATVATGKIKLAGLVLAMFSDEGILSKDGPFLIAKDRPSLGLPGQDLFGVIRRDDEEPKPNLRAAAIPQAIKPIESPIRSNAPAVQVHTRSGVAPYKAPQKIKGDLPVISIRPDAEAKGDKILLGEIADVAAEGSAKESLESAPIGDTPSIGVVRGIDAVTITSALTRAGWKLGSYVLNMTPGAKVRRQCQQVENDRFVAAAIEAVQSQLKISAPMHSDIAQPPLACPMGEVSLKPETCNRSGLGATVSVGLYVDGHRINSRVIQLSPDKDAVGVSQGQRVKIIAHAAGATVELAGKAKAQAWAGQQVSVETETGAILTGTVTGDGTVEVSL